jgi:hypothetical protein
VVALFKRGDVCLMLQRKPDVVEAFEQNMLSEWINFKFVFQSAGVCDRLGGQMNG